MKFCGATQIKTAGGFSQLLSLEGNIGVGKTTLLKLLKERIGIDPLFEPVANWAEDGKARQLGGQTENLLELFLDDPKRWGFTFQSYAFISRTRDYLDAINRSSSAGIHIMDRSVYADCICFARTAFDLGNMTNLEWEVYSKLFDWVADYFVPRPDGIIYLKAASKTCFDRIARRARSEERSVPLSYLEHIGKKHDRWLLTERDVTDRLYGVDVLVLDGDIDFEHNPAAMKSIVEQVKLFSKKLHARAVTTTTNRFKNAVLAP